MAFFAANGCSVVQVDAFDEEWDQPHLQNKVGDLERLSTVARTVLGNPRNYVGLLPVPCPEEQTPGQVDIDKA